MWLSFFHFFAQSTEAKFQAQSIDDSISIGYGLALGDVDGDGKPDILLADKKQFVWYRNGDWKKFVMAENLTEHDNVCIAARDINGDGKVEVAVGGQWNPSETTDSAQSGAVYYLVRPNDPTQIWRAVKLYHEPTIHRMRWYKSLSGKYYLIVAPLHGIGNKDGTGTGVNILVYEYPSDVNRVWLLYKLQTNMHLTHNFEIIESADKKSGFCLAGKEGVRFFPEVTFTGGNAAAQNVSGLDSASGEVRIGSSERFMATIEPMHGQNLVVYSKDNHKRMVLDTNLKEGHALAISDFTGIGTGQVVVGWRYANKDSMIGIKLYTAKNSIATEWTSQWIDKNGMACEDLKVMDLNGDGKPDIVASGRSTHNVKIYWNRSKN